ncbi:DUF3748 domain-containing protein [Sphingobacterium sp. HJSM2_6]|uniref:DUF3748 domain-containing protein n=1 Tax=Sphingobacterium sp. HJSM2_6 TaxID=3366264 RepID=UPI003BDFF802
MYETKQLTFDPSGHTLHHQGVFSRDGKYLTFDGRNDETHIGRTGSISLLDLSSGTQKNIYSTANQTLYGPGVGAVSFHPTDNKVIFIHGLVHANAEKPYDITRRTGMIMPIDSTLSAQFADIRDIQFPYTPGSLRGGTHSHAWDPSGDMLSFTYNDEFVEPQLRMVGVMLPIEDPIYIDKQGDNVLGNYYSAIVSEVVANPKPGSDEISKAFDECWLPIPSTANHKDFSGIIAFQGNTLNDAGQVITEIFTVEIDKDKILDDSIAVGILGERPHVPRGIKQQRLSRSTKGISDFRHWLRASHDGQYIYALGKDETNRNQLIQCEVSSGELSYISDFNFSIQSPINLDVSSSWITFTANKQVYIYHISKKELIQVSNHSNNELPLIGVPSFSPDGRSLVYNQLVKQDSGIFIQIKQINLEQ